MGEIFVSHSSLDEDSAVSVAAALRGAGHNVFLDTDRRDGIVPGTEWRRTLFRELRICDALVFLNSTFSQASLWCHTELAIGGELGKRTYSLDLAPHLGPHPLIQAVQGIRLESDLAASTSRLIERLQLDGLAGRSAARWARDRPPYPGLAAMDIEDAGVFFGRDADVLDLLARVDGPLGQRDGDLVVVIGPSGAGKSSLVRAGLVARLAAPPTDWIVTDPFEPGARPLDRLVNRLTALDAGRLTENECRERLLTSGLGAMADWLIDRAEPRAKRLLVTVDQGEQLSTVTQANQRDPFLEVLGHGLGAGSPVTVVMTVRSDRFDEVQRLPVIGTAIQRPVVVAPMSRSQLAAVIEGPATRADLNFEGGLVGRLIDDAVRGSTGEFVDALPLLAFTLREMYDIVVREGRRTITEADYERVGRIEGAIARRARVAESSLPPDSEPVLERLLPRFVTLSDAHLATGRPVSRQELNASEQAIVERLEDQRLLTGGSDDSGTVHLAHEQLISAWPTLAQAVADQRDDLLLESRLTRQADDWKQGAGALLGRDAVGAAISWLGRRDEAERDESTVREYVHASRTTLARRRAVAVTTMSLIVTLAIVASVVAGYAVRQRNREVAQSHVLLSGALAAESVNLMHTDAGLESLLSLESYALAPASTAARNAVADALEQPIKAILSDASSLGGGTFSPDGKTLATSDGKGDIVLWSTATRRERGRLATGEGSLASFAFSPDGTSLAAGGIVADDDGDKQNVVDLWNFVTGKRIHQLVANEDVGNLAFSTDGTKLAAGNADGFVDVWDTGNGARLAELEPGGVVTSIAFSPDGTTLATGVDDSDGSPQVGEVVLWDMSRYEPFAELKPGAAAVYSMAYSPDGKMLATGDENSNVVIWNTATRKSILILRPAEFAVDFVNSIAYSPDGKTLATGDDAGNVVLRDTASNTTIGQLRSDGSTIESIAYSPDGAMLVTSDDAGNVVLWDTTSHTRLARLKSGAATVNSVAYSTDGKTLASGDSAGAVLLWDSATRKRRVQLRPGGSVVESVAYSRDGKKLATADSGGNIVVWNATSHTRLGEFRINASEVDNVRFSPDGKTLATLDENANVILWDADHVKRVGVLGSEEANTFNADAYSPDGKTLATGDTEGDVVLWNAATRRAVSHLGSDGSTIDSIAYSPDGKTLATGDDEGDVVLWDTSSRVRIGQLRSDGSPVRSIAYSPDGATLATGDQNGNVVLWDTATGVEVGQPRPDGDASTVETIAFSPDGTTLAAGDGDGNVVLWSALDWPGGLSSLTRVLCPGVAADVTRERWAREVPNVTYPKVCEGHT